MDSITQAVLGASVFDACFGQKLGKKAIFWGLFLGTLPDLDVLARPWLSEQEFLHWHRGWSHGILFIVVMPIFLTFILRKIHGEKVSWKRGYLATFLTWLTHVLIDCFTVYGTGLFEPFSQNWVEWNYLFIIDPIYTFPLILSGIFGLFWRRSWQQKFAIGMLALSSFYVVWSFFVKNHLETRFLNSIQSEKIVVEKWQTCPTPFNTLLWRAIVKSKHHGQDGFWIGYASILDADTKVKWRWITQVNIESKNMLNHMALESINWFSKGYWIAREESDKLLVSDLRFGEITFPFENFYEYPQPWIFTWELSPDNNDITRRSISLHDSSFIFNSLWARIKGYKYDWENIKGN